MATGRAGAMPGVGRGGVGAAGGEEAERRRGTSERRRPLRYLEHFALTGLLVGVLAALLAMVLALPLGPDL